MKRKIRLTESEMVNLIERIVKEVKNEKRRQIMESRGKRRRRMNESRNRKPSLNSLKRRNRRRK